MKCAKILGAKSIGTGEIDLPVSKNGSVVFKVLSCGICGSDIHYWESGSPAGLVMGHEFCGEVVDPGSRSDLKVGDLITGLPISPCGECEACKTGNPQYCKATWSEAVGLSLTNPGGYAEYSSCRPDLVKKIGNISADEAAMVEPSSVSLHAINLANIKIGDKVLIIGGGIIGLMAAEFAKFNGASYVALLETNAKRGNKAVNYGSVDEYFDAMDSNVIANCTKKTTAGFDKVIECCGNSAAVSESMMTCKNGGTIVLVGVSLNPINVPMVVPVLGEVDMKGAIGYTEKEFEDVIGLINDKKIDVIKYVDDRVSLDQVQESFIRLTSGEDDAVKILIKP